MLPSFQSWIGLATRLAAHVEQLARDAGGAAVPVAVIAAIAGVALLVAGVRLGPMLAGAAGAAIAWAVALRVPPLAGSWGVPAALQPWLAAAVVGLASAFVPVLYPIVVGALPGALWGASLPVLGHAWLGAALAAVVLGAVALALRRLIVAATAAVPGALLVVGALIALTPRFRSLAGVTGRPTLLLGLAALLAIAGTAGQLAIQPASSARGRRGAPAGRRNGRLDE